MRGDADEPSPTASRGLPTAAKLLLILTAVLLPIGIALTWVGETGIREANAALRGPQPRTRRRPPRGRSKA